MKRTASVDEETGKIQVISMESSKVGTHEPLSAEEMGIPLPGIPELHPKRVGPDSQWPVQHKRSSATLSTPEALFLSRISEGGGMGQGWSWGQKAKETEPFYMLFPDLECPPQGRRGGSVG